MEKTTDKLSTGGNAKSAGCMTGRTHVARGTTERLKTFANNTELKNHKKVTGH